MRGQESRWEETGGNWKKIKKSKTKPRKAPTPPRVSINQKQNRIGIGVACEFAPEKVDIYVRGNGAGKGFRIALVEAKKGEFKVNKSRIGNKSRPSGMCINAKSLLRDDLDIKPGYYDASTGVVHGERALIFNAFSRERDEDDENPSS